ncbi:actin remodeling regulator NHS isoform X2 [Genypterus blacodes]|uniref:actin remodeling regulator NHS isoform X2 n=1 Tax=Genypterus blacodes TaxID=154954 RepID=UPI003F773A08
MPFAKRVVEPQLLCRLQVPDADAVLCDDLSSISNVALSRTLRQLSDLAKHACSIFQDLEGDLTSTSQRIRGLQNKINRLQQSNSELDPKQEAVPVSNLDVESKLTTHYQSACHQHRNIFLPSTRPACVEELHRQAKLSLWALHRDPHQRPSGSRERRVTISISALPPMPLYPSPRLLHKRDKRGGGPLSTFDSIRSSSPTDCCHFSPWSRKAVTSDPDPEGVALGQRSKFPILNIPSTLDKQTNWSKALPLPTPEERMKSSSGVISSCVIPINVTGLGFDRDASVRCSLVHSQSVLQRRRKLRRRRTIAGFPRQLQLDLDSDDSPGSRECRVIVHAGADASHVSPSSEDLASRLSTRDSGCQTEEFLTSGAPSRRRIRSHRGQGAPLCLSYSAGNISSLPDSTGAMFAASVDAHLRSRSLPRDGSHLRGESGDDSDEEEEELSPFHTEDFLPVPALILKDEEESLDEQTHQQHAESPEHSWRGRGRAQLPGKADLGSCEISSSSDTFSSPVHSGSAAGVLGGPMDHKDDHQSSSGNWSGSSSTCPSQTSETIAPAASPPLTGSSHCDSELSLNAATHANDDHSSFILEHIDRFQGLRTQRTGSFSSTAMDPLEEAGVRTPCEGEWTYPLPEPPRSQDLSPEPREAESSLGCPSFTSMATCESSFSDKPPSEKADTVSHYSVDTEGYYTSMHFDCGLKESRSFSYSASDCMSELSGHTSFGSSCLSLRKPKAKPSPPQRSSSLRKICSEGNISEQQEVKTSCGQQQRSASSRDRKLQLDLTGSPAHIETSSVEREPAGLWGVQDSAELPDLGVFSSTDAHSFKDEGVVQSEYADLWLLHDLKSSDPYRSLSNSSTATGTTVIECIKSQESSGSQTSQSGSRSTTPSLPSVDGDFKLTSPERLAGLGSPSSGYSSQSETPTSSFPSAFFPGPLSPACGKRKPKVPERKSSLPSLSCRDGASSPKTDLELPVIPPSHLDLSALHSVSDKVSAHRTQIQILQNKQKALSPLTTRQMFQSDVFTGRPMSITPTVLHSVQLRSFSKENGLHDDITKADSPSRLKGPPVNCPSPVSSRASVYQQVCESVFLSKDQPADVSYQSQKDGRLPLPSDAMTAFRFQSEASEQQLSQEEERTSCQEGDTSVDSSLWSEDRSSQSESLQPQRAEGSEEELQTQETSLLQTQPQRPEGEDEAPETSEGETLRTSEVREQSGPERLQDSKDSTEATDPEEHRDQSAQISLTAVEEETRTEEDNLFVSPTKTRTTEDLFAMIHRSKRKVLGRKDSSELGVRSRLCAAASSPSTSNPPSPAATVPAVATVPTVPTTPTTVATAAASTPPGLQKTPGPIYRNAKKSSTSNEEFKLLLLKKGSRSDSSYRMSATEILKSPVTPKSLLDSLMDSPGPPEEAGSPSPQQQQQQQQSSPGPDQPCSLYPKANAEGFSPKSCPPYASSRQSRSRIPPPASSSRYAARRLYSAPMQAISEGEAENSDGSPHEDRSAQGPV